MLSEMKGGGGAARRVVIIGDSHTIALKEALVGLPESENGPIFSVVRLKQEPRSSATKGQDVEDLLALVRDATPDEVFVLALRGNHYNSFGLMQHPRPFDFTDQAEAGVAPHTAAEQIPYTLMRDYFDALLRRGYGRILRQLAELNAAPMLCLSSPAPKEDAEFILRHAESHFVSSGLADSGVSPASTRLRLWTLQNRVLKDFCDEIGVKFLWNPDGVRDEHGYLRREFYANDATHANASYGALVLRQIAEAIL